jgi:hypothetical protein
MKFCFKICRKNSRQIIIDDRLPFYLLFLAMNLRRPELSMQTFFFSQQIANARVLGLIALSQIRKFFNSASSQNANAQMLIFNPQIRKFLQYTTEHNSISKQS